MRDRVQRFTETAHKGHRRRAVIFESFQRGRRNGVDSFGTDEIIDVNRIRIGRILGASARPQRTLNTRALVFEFFPTRACKCFLIFIIGEFGIGDGSFAFEVRAIRQMWINFGINARNEERSNRCNVVNGMSRRGTVFQPAEISVHHFGVTCERKNQRDIDVNTCGNCLTNGRDASLRGRNFDHQVFACHTRPQLLGLCSSAFGIVRNIRADFQTDISIAAIRFFIQWRERIARGFDIFNGKLPKDFLCVPASPGERRERGVVIIRLRNRVVEDGRVGCNATNIAAFDHGFEFAIFQNLALDVIVPDGLTELCEFCNWVHRFSRFQV